MGKFMELLIIKQKLFSEINDIKIIKQYQDRYKTVCIII